MSIGAEIPLVWLPRQRVRELTVLSPCLVLGDDFEVDLGVEPGKPIRSDVAARPTLEGYDELTTGLLARGRARRHLDMGGRRVG